MKLNNGDIVTISGTVVEGGGGDIPHLIELSSGITIWIHDDDIQTAHPAKKGEKSE